MAINTDEHPIAISILYYTLFLSAGSLLRSIIRKFVPTQHQTYWLDLVTTFSVLACSLENSHVRQQYGYGAYIALLYMLVTWYSMTLFDSNSNPVYNVVAFAQGHYSLPRMLWLTTAQFLGAWLSYRAAFAFWSLGLCVNHRRRIEAVDCATDLNVPALLGLLIESSGTAFDIFLSLCEFTSSPQIELSVKLLIVCLLTASAIHLTGFYLNPMNASNQSIGCTGTSLPIHFLVYWVGPCVTAYLITRALPHIRKLLQIDTDLGPDYKLMDQTTTNGNLNDKEKTEKEAKKDDANEDSSDEEEDKTNSKKDATKVNTSDKVDKTPPKKKSSEKLKKS